jgi:hypothetical protein
MHVKGLHFATGANRVPLPESIAVHPVPFEDELLDRGYVAGWLGVDYDTLGAWDRKGKGPPLTRIGRMVKYLRKDVLTWLEEQRNARRPVRPPKPYAGRKRGRPRNVKLKPSQSKTFRGA